MFNTQTQKRKEIITAETVLSNLKEKEYNMGELLTGTKGSHTITGYEEKNIFVPKTDPNYMIAQNPIALNVGTWMLHSDDPLYIYGPTGCGKTTLVKYMFSLINYPVLEVTGHSRLESPELLGHHVIVDGNMSFQYGPLSLAYKYGGLFLLNEIDLLDPSTAAGLNTVLDGSPLCIPENGGELIAPHPMFRFVATANTNGSNDETGLYQGTLRQNLAFMDRFTVLESDYLNAGVEKSILQRICPKLTEEAYDRMLATIQVIREGFMGIGENQFEITASTRTLIRWGKTLTHYEKLMDKLNDEGKLIHPITGDETNIMNYTLEIALTMRASKSTRTAIKEIISRNFVDILNKKSAIFR